MTRLEIRMPRLSEYSDVGKVIKWRVNAGDMVEKGDVLAEIDADMTRTEVQAQAAGKLDEIWVHAGQEVPVETVIAMLRADDAEIVDESVAEEPPVEEPAATEPAAPAAEDEEVFPELGEPNGDDAAAGEQYGQVLASPEAIELALQHHINLETLIGTGTSGRVERADVEAAMKANSRYITPEDIDDLMNFEGDFSSKMPSDEAPPAPAPADADPVAASADSADDETTEIEVEVPADDEMTTAEEEAAAPAVAAEPEVREVASPTPDVIYMAPAPEPEAESVSEFEPEPEALAIDESDTIGAEEEPDADFIIGNDAEEPDAEEPDAEEPDAEEPDAEAAPEPEFEAAPEPESPPAATTAPENVPENDQSKAQPPGKQIKVRRLIARKMHQSWLQAPHFFVTVAVNMTDVIRFRSDLGVTINDFILAATTRALQQHPWVNSHFIDDEAIEQPAVNISLAVETEQGLYYPVVRDCAGKSVREIGIAAAEMVAKAHSGKLTDAEMEGGSFTISNMGMLDVESFSAIITPPQVAVLAVGTVRGEVIIDEYEEMSMAPMVRLTLSGDHRALDGADAADFLGTMKSYLEAPITLVESQVD